MAAIQLPCPPLLKPVSCAIFNSRDLFAVNQKKRGLALQERLYVYSVGDSIHQKVGGAPMGAAVCAYV